MKKKPVLVDLERLRVLIAGLELGDEKFNDCIDARWVNYIEWWDSRFARRQMEVPAVARVRL